MFFHLKHGLVLSLHPFHHLTVLSCPLLHLLTHLHHAHTHARHPLLLHPAHLLILLHHAHTHTRHPLLLHTTHLVILHHRTGLRLLRRRGPCRDQHHGCRQCTR